MNFDFSLEDVKIVDIDSISPHPRNPHKIKTEDVAIVEESIKDFGFVQPIAIWTDNVIRIGHTRHAAAKKLGMKKVPVVVLSRLTENQADALLAIDNQTHAGFKWDYDKLADLIQTDGETDWGKFFSANELSSLLNEEEPDEPVPEVELPPTYKLIVNCESEADQNILYQELIRKGYDVYVPGKDEANADQYD